MIQVLHIDTSLEAIQFGETMIDEGLWIAKSAKASQRLVRAKEIVTEGEALRIEHIDAKESPSRQSEIEVQLSALAIELSEISNAAIDDKSLDFKHLDPWVMTNPIENDQDNRDREDFLKIERKNLEDARARIGSPIIQSKDPHMPTAKLTTIVQEFDAEGLRTLSITEMLCREVPVTPVYDDKERVKLRKAILKDLSRCVDMLLTGQGDRITIERDVR